eukprot:24431-Heterocapsa_arctica.AAC.1
MRQLKHLGRYIVGTKDYVRQLLFDQDARRGVIEVYVDANWASSPDRKSTSGGLITYEGFVLQHWSRTQPCISQSTCEAEL